MKLAICDFVVQNLIRIFCYVSYHITHIHITYDIIKNQRIKHYLKKNIMIAKKFFSISYFLKFEECQIFFK